MCISTTETIQTILALALTSHRYVVAQPSVLVSTGVIRKMKKAEVQRELRSRGMNVSGTVTVLKGCLLEKVQREKRGAAQPPSLNVFTLTRAQMISVLKAYGSTVHSKMRRYDMVERLVTVLEKDKQKRESRKRSSDDQGQSTKRQRTGEKSERSWLPVKVEIEVDLSAAASFLAMPVTMPAKATATVVKTAFKGGKKAAKTAHRAGSAVKSRVQGFKKYRQEGGRKAYDKRVRAKAEQLQKVHNHFGKKKFLGVSSVFGVGFGPKGLSYRKALRVAREDEDARLRRQKSDPVIKGFFGRDAEVERCLKEARWNAVNVNSKTVATDVARATMGTPSPRPFGRRVENPHSRPTRPCRRYRVQVKFDL